MTSEDMDRHATLAMTVLFHNAGRRSGFMQVGLSRKVDIQTSDEVLGSEHVAARVV
jgi:hypothetical protein